MKAIKPFLFLWAFLLFNPGLAQEKAEFKEALHQSYGLSGYLDIISAPATIYEDNFGNTLVIQPSGTSYFTGAYRVRYNLAELSDNVALSTSLSPALGFTFFNHGFLHINLPGMIKFEFGAKSTKKSEADFGVVAGAGYELNAAPVIVDRPPGLPGGTRLETIWVQKAFSLGIRFKRGSNFMEISFKYGEGPGKRYGSNLELIKARSLRLMAYYFIGK